MEMPAAAKKKSQIFFSSWAYSCTFTEKNLLVQSWINHKLLGKAHGREEEKKLVHEENRKYSCVCAETSNILSCTKKSVE